MEIMFIIVGLGFLILQIVMIVKFFEIAGNVSKMTEMMSHYLNPNKTQSKGSSYEPLSKSKDITPPAETHEAVPYTYIDGEVIFEDGLKCSAIHREYYNHYGFKVQGNTYLYESRDDMAKAAHQYLTKGTISEYNQI